MIKLRKLGLIPILLVTSLLGVSACGGGGGSSTGITCAGKTPFSTVNVGSSVGGSYLVSGVPIFFNNMSVDFTNDGFPGGAQIVDIGFECFSSITSMPGGGSTTVALIPGKMYVVQYGGNYWRIYVVGYSGGIATLDIATGLA